MKFQELDTPSMLFDREIIEANLKKMQDYANQQGVALRPHTKTHKCPRIAQMQKDLGAVGITVAKLGEAEVMAENGLDNIFIANEIVGDIKLRRMRKLAETKDISFGVDSPCQVEAAERIFKDAAKPAQVVIEIEVGENRSGIIEENDFIVLLDTIQKCAHVKFLGIFSHEGHCYNADNMEDCHEKFVISQKRTLHFAQLAKEKGMACKRVSIGSTPSLLFGFDIMPGITEFRPGTYVLMDASMANVIHSLNSCAATVLATVISKPTSERVILDVGAKGITMQERTVGITATPGKGTIWEFPDVHIYDVYDEHAIIYNKKFHDTVEIGDKVRIVPVHICPTCNLFETANLISGEEVIEEIPILCRAKLK